MPSRIAVKPLREAYGLSQAEFAKLVPIDTRTVRRWELGEVSPSPLALARLSQMREEIDTPADSETEHESPTPAARTTPRRRAASLGAPLPLGMPGGAEG